jgi:hypothetical protein
MNKLQIAVDETSLWLLFAMIGGAGASVLALGMLLRSNETLTKRVVMGTLLHSAAWGAAMFLIGYSRYTNDLPFLVGLSIFSGMGVASSLDLVLLLVKQRLGISVTINPPSAKDSQ